MYTVVPPYSHPLYKHNLYIFTLVLGPVFYIVKCPLYYHKLIKQLRLYSSEGACTLGGEGTLISFTYGACHSTMVYPGVGVLLLGLV